MDTEPAKIIRRNSRQQSPALENGLGAELPDDTEQQTRESIARKRAELAKRDPMRKRHLAEDPDDMTRRFDTDNQMEGF